MHVKSGQTEIPCQEGQCQPARVHVAGRVDSALAKQSRFNTLRDEIDPTVAAISTLLILISVILLVLRQIFEQRRQKS